MIGNAGTGCWLFGLGFERYFWIPSCYFSAIYNDLVKCRVRTVTQSCSSFTAPGFSCPNTSLDPLESCTWWLALYFVFNFFTGRRLFLRSFLNARLFRSFPIPFAGFGRFGFLFRLDSLSFSDCLLDWDAPFAGFRWFGFLFRIGLLLFSDSLLDWAAREFIEGGPFYRTDVGGIDPLWRFGCRDLRVCTNFYK